MIKLLITDLDDTLYSWIGFFVPAFYGMAEELSHILKKEKNLLLDEYRKIHQEKGSVEYPYATIHLPSVKRAYPGFTQEELLKELNPAFHKFNSIRKKQLQLYPYVKETLNKLVEMDIKIVGYTESAEENGFYRLKKLEVDELFQRVYVSYSQFERPNHIPSSAKTEIVLGKKPNPKLIKQICEHESVSIDEAIYIGDSMTKDIYMAKTAGVTSVLYKHPSDPQIAEDLYDKLVAISHWTKADFQHDIELRAICKDSKFQPDYVIDSFDLLIKIIKTINNIA